MDQESCQNTDLTHEKYKDYFYSVKYTTLVFAISLLLLIFYNIYNYLYKQKRYKQCTISLFYAASIATIICLCGYLAIAPFNCTCQYNWLIYLYGMTYLNLILGISQVGTLASLAFQLRCFFKYSHEVQNEMVGEMRLGTRCEFKKLELEMAKKVQIRKRIILTLVIVSVLLISGIFVFHVYYWHYIFNKKGLCIYSKL